MSAKWTQKMIIVLVKPNIAKMKDRNNYFDVYIN